MNSVVVGMADSLEYDLENGKYGPKGTAGYTGSPNKHAINAFIAEFCFRKKDYIKENNCLNLVIDAMLQGLVKLSISC